MGGGVYTDDDGIEIPVAIRKFENNRAENFDRDVSVLKNLRGHPYIIHMYHECVSGDARFVAFETELVDLKALFPGKISELLVQKIVYQMMAALKSLEKYEKTIFIKPENILVKMDGQEYDRFILADFFSTQNFQKEAELMYMNKRHDLSSISTLTFSLLTGREDNKFTQNDREVLSHSARDFVTQNLKSFKLFCDHPFVSSYKPIHDMVEQNKAQRAEI